MIATLYDKNNYLCDSGILTRRELKYFNSITEDMPGINMAISLQSSRYGFDLKVELKRFLINEISSSQ